MSARREASSRHATQQGTTPDSGQHHGRDGLSADPKHPADEDLDFNLDQFDLSYNRTKLQRGAAGTRLHTMPV